MKKNSEEKDSFCIYPFTSLNIMPAGTAKPCCAYGTTLQDADRPMSVYDHSVADIWNSQAMRDLRRDFIEGNAIPNCEYCFKQERVGLESMRTAATDALKWNFDSTDSANKQRIMVDNLKQQAIDNNFAMPIDPSFLALDLGNLCNLKCRMCNSTYSSAIAADPVHVKWSPPSPEHARWKNKNLAIAPTSVLGVSYRGVIETLGDEDNRVAWLDDSAAFTIDKMPLGATGFSLQISSAKPKNQNLQVLVNSKIVFDGPLPEGTWNKTFNFPADAQGAIEIGIKSPLFLNPLLGRKSGIGIQNLQLHRDEKGSNSIAIGRMDGSNKWYDNQDFIESELFRLPEGIDRVRLIGGEPMLIKGVRFAMRHLISQGVASKITLDITTNGTVIDDELMDMMAQFKKVQIVFSLDGVGEVNEYIRFPSRWDVIEKNVTRLCQLPNAALRLNMTIQAYNLLDIENMIRFSEASGMFFGYHLLQWPYHLNAMMLPHSVRNDVAGRLRTLALGNDLPSSIYSGFKESILQLADTISAEFQTDEKLLKEFMRFTNDLDKSRGQDISKSLPEIHRIVSDQMGGWSSDLQFAN